ncbi:hypothetical protein Tco_1079738 [Tanacetum coccineum]|uniref:Uncharacterized protein n=1 Tax=Tanacetum coccineum TaxID=301880 RepID=A0ABQ5HUR4_9ASTR
MVRCFKTSIVVREMGSTAQDDGVSTGYEHRRSVAVSCDQIRRSNRVALDVAGEEVVGPGGVEMVVKCPTGCHGEDFKKEEGKQYGMLGSMVFTQRSCLVSPNNISRLFSESMFEPETDDVVNSQLVLVKFISLIYAELVDLGYILLTSQVQIGYYECWEELYKDMKGDNCRSFLSCCP